jgi:hypothetical protein
MAWTVWWPSHRPGASAASAIVVSPKTSCSQASYYSRVRNDLTPARPPPLSRTRSTRRASGSTGSDRGAWGDPLVTSAAGRPGGESATARSRGCGPSTTSNPGRPRPSGSPATRSWRPESATWSGCTWSRRRMRSCCVWTRSRRSRRWSAPSLPAPTPALPVGDIGAEQRLIGAVEGVADDRLGERPARPHLRKLASKALLYRCAASRAAMLPGGWLP